MSKKKYLRKNEFRYDNNPAVRNPKGEGHVAYISAKQGRKAKINIITHGKHFFNEPTEPLSRNPEINGKDRRPSRFSVPRWENDKYLKDPPRGIWRLSKMDRVAVRKFNRKYRTKK